MGGDGKKDASLDVSMSGYAGRLEVLEGPTGRRSRSASEKARIAAESLQPGARVAEIARQHGTTRWQIYDWRRRLQKGELVLPEKPSSLFARVVVEEAQTAAVEPVRSVPTKIEIEADGLVIRTTIVVERLSEVLRAVRASR